MKCVKSLKKLSVLSYFYPPLRENRGQCLHFLLTLVLLTETYFFFEKSASDFSLLKIFFVPSYYLEEKNKCKMMPSPQFSYFAPYVWKTIKNLQNLCLMCIFHFFSGNFGKYVVISTSEYFTTFKSIFIPFLGTVRHFEIHPRSGLWTIPDFYNIKLSLLQED